MINTKKIGQLLMVRENESLQVFYFFLIYIIAGCGNSFGRSSTDALFFKRFGIENLPIMYIILGFSLSLISLFYAAFADRIKPERFFVIMYAVLIAALLSNWSMMTYGTNDYIYPVYFLVYEIASEVFLIHAAFYLSQNFDSMQAKRVFPLIMSGTLIGNIIGGTVVSQIAKFTSIHNIIILWCLLIALAAILISLWHKKYGSSPYYRAQHKSSRQFKQAINQITYGAKLLKTSNLLKFSSLALFFMVITFYILCFSVNSIYTHTFTTEEELTAFFGKLTAGTSFIALTLQIFITNKAITRFGAKKVNLFFPLTSLVSYAGLMTSFAFFPALVGSINKDSIMPAFRNPVRAIFFNAIPENIRGRAFSIQLTLILPLALVVCGSMLVFMLKMGEPLFFLSIGFCAALCYLYCNYRMNNAYLSEILANLKNRVIIPGAGRDLKGLQNTDINAQEISNKICNFDNKSLVSVIKILIKTNPEIATTLILNNTFKTTPAVRDQIISLFASLNPDGFIDYLWKSYAEADNHLKFTILKNLFRLKDQQAIDMIPSLLEKEDNKLVAAGIIGCIETNKTGVLEQHLKKWNKIIESENPDDHFLALKLIEYLNSNFQFFDKIKKSYKNRILEQLRKYDDPTLILETLNALEKWPNDDFNELEQYLESIYEKSSNKIKIKCIHSCDLLDNPADNNIIRMALDEVNPTICLEAVKLVYKHTKNANHIFYQRLTDQCKCSTRTQSAMLAVLLKNNSQAEYFSDIAYYKAKQAFDLNEILGHLACSRINSSAISITKHAIEEKIQHYIDLALLALQSHEHPDDIEIIREGLKSKDSRYIANAHEILTHLKNKKITEILSSLIDKANYKSTVCKLDANVNDYLDAINWCKKHNDPWIRYCAQHVTTE